MPRLAITLPLLAIFDPPRLVLRKILALAGRTRTSGNSGSCAGTGDTASVADSARTRSGSGSCAGTGDTGSGCAATLLEKIGRRAPRPCSTGGSRSATRNIQEVIHLTCRGTGAPRDITGRRSSSGRAPSGTRTRRGPSASGWSAGPSRWGTWPGGRGTRPGGWSRTRSRRRESAATATGAGTTAPSPSPAAAATTAPATGVDLDVRNKGDNTQNQRNDRNAFHNGTRKKSVFMDGLEGKLP